MTLTRRGIVLLVVAGLAGCKGTVELSCDEVTTYQLAAEGRRVEAPADLDALDPLREMPVPEASPQPPRPPNSPCIDRPPEVKLGDDN